MRRLLLENFYSLVQRNTSLEARYFVIGYQAGVSRRPLWMRATASVMAFVMYAALVSFLFDEVAQAAPIVDPRAPIQFQPSITQTSTAVPAVNITAPNANGISVNNFQSLNVDGTGRTARGRWQHRSCFDGDRVPAVGGICGRV